VIRIGVIGAGELAQAHAAAFSAAGGATVTVGGEELLSAGSIDAAVIASVPEARFHHTALALENRLDVLVEQPLAPTVENAQMLERIASLRPVRPVVQVSAADHFNPALRRLLDERLVAIEFRRRGGGPSGLLSDVRTLVSIARSPLLQVHASGGGAYSIATLVFESGLVGTLSGGEAGPGPGHEVIATRADALIAIDALTGTIAVTRDGVCERTQVPVGDSLTAQARSFCGAIRERGRPDVGLRTAAACLEVGERIRECLALQAAATGVPSETAP
jgi:predicted dehydrogenase